MSNQNPATMTLPFEIRESLLASVCQNQSLFTMFHSFFAINFALDGEPRIAPEAQIRTALNAAIGELPRLNRALSALGANKAEGDARKLMDIAFEGRHTWGNFACVEHELVRADPSLWMEISEDECALMDPLSLELFRNSQVRIQNSKMTTKTIGEANLEPTPMDVLWTMGLARAWALFGLSCLQRFLDTGSVNFLLLTAEALVYNIEDRNRSAFATLSARTNSGALRRVKAKADEIRALGSRTQAERKEEVRMFARSLVEPTRASFRSATHAAEEIQSQVLEYADSISHPLTGTRIQTITDMLKGIKFGKKKQQSVRARQKSNNP